MKRLTRRKLAVKERLKLVPKGKELSIHTKPNRCKPTPLRQLEAEQVEAIWQAVRVEFYSHEQAAAQFGISTKLVQNLISSIKKDPQYIEKLRKKESHKDCKRELTIEVISGMKSRGIWRSS